MANTSCGSAELKAYRDESAAFVLKLIVVASILLAVVVEVTIPLVSKNRSFLHTNGSFFVVAKAFAARVILATGFVHMLPEGSAALNDPCLPEYPWAKFPFSEFFAMMASLARLLVNFVETQYYERKQERLAPLRTRCRSRQMPCKMPIFLADRQKGLYFG